MCRQSRLASRHPARWERYRLTRHCRSSSPGRASRFKMTGTKTVVIEAPAGGNSGAATIPGAIALDTIDVFGWLGCSRSRCAIPDAGLIGLHLERGDAARRGRVDG